MPLVASFGSSLNLYDFAKGNFELVDTYSNSSSIGNIINKRLCWAGSGLVCGVKDTGLIPIFQCGLHHSENNLRVVRRLHPPNASAATFFNWNNTNLVVGDKNGAVSIWDVKQKKELKSFVGKLQKKVEFLGISSDDDYIAAGGKHDIIDLYNCKTNQNVSTLKTNLEEELSDLKFSPLRRNYLAHSTLESSVVMWDINTGTSIMHLKNVHTSACSGIVCSPTNSNVVVSVSLSETFKVHDVRHKKTVFSLDTNKSLYCIDMLKERPIVLVGSMDGYITAYDLRNAEVVAEVKAYNGKVLSLKAAISSNVSKKKQFKEADINTPDESVSEKNMISFADIISPLVPGDRVSPILSLTSVKNDVKAFMEAVPGGDSSPHISSVIVSHSTPSTTMATSLVKKSYSQASPLSVGLNKTDSFIKQMATPEIDAEFSPISIKSGPFLNNITVSSKNVTEPVVRDVVSDLSTVCLESILTEITSLKNDFQEVKAVVEKSKEEIEKNTELIKKTQEDNQLMMSDIIEEVLYLKELINFRFSD